MSTFHKRGYSRILSVQSARLQTRGRTGLTRRIVTVARIGARSTRRSETGSFVSRLCRRFWTHWNAADLTTVDPRDRAQRIGYIATAIVLGAGLLVGRIAYLQATDHVRWMDLASKQHGTSVDVFGARGTIRDRVGRELALSIETLLIGANPGKIRDHAVAAQQIAAAIDVPVESVASRLAEKKKYVVLASGVSREKLPRLRALSMRGLEIDPEVQRIYPHGTVGRTILGPVSREGRGQSGIELRYDRELRASDYTLQLQRDARGRLLPKSFEQNNFFQVIPAAFDSRVDSSPPVPGKLFREEGGDLTLTIDSFLQRVVEEEFGTALKESQAKRVFGLILEAQTGEILALAQVSTEDSGGKSAKGYLSPESLRNGVLQDSFEPGSTFKALVAAEAMERGLLKTTEVMDCENGRYKVGPHIVRDVHPVGVVPFSEVLVRSSNVCMAKVGQRLGKRGLLDFLGKFQFGQKTGIELPGEAKGLLRREAEWKPIDTATTSFGQGVSVTALQLVRAYAALANGGRLVTPTLIHREVPLASERVLSQKIAENVSLVLQGVIDGEHGTGTAAAIAGLAISGKTGTAQKANHNRAGYDPDRVLSSFVGFVDGTQVGIEEKLVMFVGVDEPGVKPRWGGVVAAPVFRRAMERAVTHLMTNRLPIRTAHRERDDDNG
ncbi:MAG: penicillin-binding protein 2 [Deltaproteobacteria bacterium]|nr:penicillin-binding protein 2 [Deltaproteobacteria bacterium]